MTGSVLDILIYVFDQYMLAEAPEVPEREALAADLERAGFGRHNVERALDWLADLAGERSRPDMASRALRVRSSALQCALRAKPSFGTRAPAPELVRFAALGAEGFDDKYSRDGKGMRRARTDRSSGSSRCRPHG